MSRFYEHIPMWEEIIAASFLTDDLKEQYLVLIQDRFKQLGY